MEPRKARNDTETRDAGSGEWHRRGSSREGSGERGEDHGPSYDRKGRKARWLLPRCRRRIFPCPSVPSVVNDPLVVPPPAMVESPVLPEHVRRGFREVPIGLSQRGIRLPDPTTLPPGRETTARICRGRHPRRAMPPGPSSTDLPQPVRRSWPVWIGPAESHYGVLPPGESSGGFLLDLS